MSTVDFTGTAPPRHAGLDPASIPPAMKPAARPADWTPAFAGVTDREEESGMAGMTGIQWRRQYGK